MLADQAKIRVRVVRVLVGDQQRREALGLAGGRKYDIGRGCRTAVYGPW